MQYYDKLLPEELREQCRSAKQILRQNNEDIQQIRKSLQEFIEDDQLTSAAYNALKTQISDYLSVISAMITANEMDIRDLEQLESKVGDEKLIGEIILSQKEEARRDEEKYSDKASSYYWKASNESWLSTAKTWYYNRASYYSCRADAAWRRYEFWHRKEQKFEEINYITSHLFTESHQLREASERALAGITGTFREGDYMIDLGAEWRNIITGEQNRLTQDTKKRFLRKKGKEGQTYDWEEIRTYLEKEVDEVSDLEYMALVEMMSEMTEENLETLITTAQKENILTGAITCSRQDVLREVSERYLANATIVAELTIFAKGSKYNYDEAAVTNDLSKAVLMAQLTESRIGYGAEHYAISSTEKNGKLTYIAEVKVTASGYHVTLEESIAANNLMGRTIKVNPWGSTQTVDFDLRDCVIETLYSLDKSVAGIFAQAGGEQAASYVFDRIGQATAEEVGKTLSTTLGVAQFVSDMTEAHENSVSINSAIDSVNTGKIIESLGISAGVVNVTDSIQNRVQLISPKYDPEELLVRVAAYNHANERQITVKELKEAVSNNGEILWEYMDWYGEGGDEEINDYWTALDNVAIIHREMSSNKDRISVHEMSIEQLQELINKYEDSSYEINDEIMRGKE